MTNLIVAPGQGSQSEGFLAPFIEQVASFRELLSEYSEVVDLDLIELGTAASEERIKDTAIAQPLIVAASLASFRTLPALGFDGVAGHSVGEFTAAAIAGVMDDATALKLVSVRSKAMAKAAAKVDTSMAAVIGGEISDVEVALASHNLVGANYNGANQIVAAGLTKDVRALVSNPPEKARVIELKVAGAFHTQFMDDAKLELEEYAKGLDFNDPTIALWSNQAGQLIESGSEFVRLLVNQVSNPVRWDLVMQQFVGRSAQIVELLPGGALSGLLKRAVEDCRTVPLRTPQDFEKVS